MSTELAHYGVKGMKWGRRRSSVRSVAKKNLVKRTESEREFFRELRTGLDNPKGSRATVRAINITNRLTMGKKLTGKYYDKVIEHDTKRIDRVNAGKATLLDKRDALVQLPIRDLIIERRD